MTRQEIANLIESLIDETKTGVLATVDEKGDPQIRWMTPVCLRGSPGTLFMVTGANFGKVKQAREHPSAKFMLQTQSLDTVVTLQGSLTVLENPSLRNDVLECLGPRLQIFWKVNQKNDELVVLEFVIQEAVGSKPLKGSRETVVFV